MYKMLSYSANKTSWDLLYPSVKLGIHRQQSHIMLFIYLSISSLKSAGIVNLHHSYDRNPHSPCTAGREDQE